MKMIFIIVLAILSSIGSCVEDLDFLKSVVHMADVTDTRNVTFTNGPPIYSMNYWSSKDSAGKPRLNM